MTKIKEEVLPEESSISFAEKLLSNVVKEMSSTDKGKLKSCAKIRFSLHNLFVVKEKKREKNYFPISTSDMNNSLVS